MPGTNRDTGRPLEGWDHVVQSLQVIFTTRFNERVMIRFFGSLVPHMLGRSVSEPLILRFIYSIMIAIELWEPRFRVVKATPEKLTRAGEFSLRLDGKFLPNATVNDFTVEHTRSFLLVARQTGLVINPVLGT